MRTKSTGGFTLIELLIVIAIIGILAAVLIPNLMSARTSAQNRAAQAHSSNVYTALMAHLADSPTLSVSDVAGAAPVCTAAGDIGNYGWPAPPASAGCTISGATGDFTVTVTMNGETFINGRQSAAGSTP